MESLVSKYRPQRLADVLGQDQIVRHLTAFVRAPYSTAFLLSGITGCGKSAAAHALAGDLGCALEEGEIGGLVELPCGSQGADDVRRLLDRLQCRPMFGNGWKVAVLNEADRMTAAAEVIWLDALEHLPSKTVVVFTTNAASSLTRRFKDRCELFEFESSVERLAGPIAALCRKVWRSEGGTGDPPRLTDLGMPRLGSADTMTPSFRRALQELQPYLRSLVVGGQEQKTVKLAGLADRLQGMFREEESKLVKGRRGQRTKV